MQLPKLTDLQFLVLGTLADAELSAEDLRERLSEGRTFGIGIAAFCRLMLRLEDMGLVDGRYESKKIGDHPIREKYYKVTGQGRTAFNEKLQFTAAIAAETRGAFNV